MVFFSFFSGGQEGRVIQRMGEYVDPIRQWKLESGVGPGSKLGTSNRRAFFPRKTDQFVIKGPMFSLNARGGIPWVPVFHSMNSVEWMRCKCQCI